jgi:hypothetical protein
LEDDLKKMKKKNCKFKEIIVLGDFEIGNGVLGLERDIYLNIVKFLNFSIIIKVNKYFFFYLFC